MAKNVAIIVLAGLLLVVAGLWVASNPQWFADLQDADESPRLAPDRHNDDDDEHEDRPLGRHRSSPPRRWSVSACRLLASSRT